jgi:cytochrome d ubiquinol oxidase subunit II
VLWLLMGRGLALELRNHFDTRMWHEFWDLVFSVSSALLIVVFGVALGNLVRGLPLGADGFFEGSFALLLNPFALAVGVLALCILSLHGLHFVNMRVPWSAPRHGPLARILWALVIALYLVVTVWALFVHPLQGPRFVWAALLAAASLAGLVGAWRFAGRQAYTKAFLSSSLFIGSLMVAAAVTIFPYVVPSNSANPGISIYDAAPSPAALAGLLAVLGFGLTAVLIYSINVTRALWGPIERAPL